MKKIKTWVKLKDLDSLSHDPHNIEFISLIVVILYDYGDLTFKQIARLLQENPKWVAAYHLMGYATMMERRQEARKKLSKSKKK